MVSGPLVSGIASLIVGIIAIIIGVVISQAIKTAIHDGIESAVTIKSKTGDNYDSWRTNTGGAAAEAFRSFYMYNITNLHEVVKDGVAPIYNEIGPFVYQNLNEKIDVHLNKTTHSAFYRTYSRYIFRRDLSAMSDKVRLAQVNPGYILAAYTNTKPSDPANPVPATEVGVFAKVVSGAFAMIDSQLGPSSTFPTLVKSKRFQEVFDSYRTLLVEYKYGNSITAFVAAMTSNTPIVYSPYMTGVSSAIVAKLLDDSNGGSLMHPNNYWMVAVQNMVNGALSPAHVALATGHLGTVTPAEIKAITKWILSFFAKQQPVMTQGLPDQSSYSYDDEGYTQFANMNTLNGLSLRHMVPSAPFYPELAAFMKYEMAQTHVVMTGPVAKILITGNPNFPGLKAAAGVGGLLLKAPILLNTTNPAHSATLKIFGFENVHQVIWTLKYGVYLYQTIMNPVCSQMMAEGNCFYRVTTVENLLFGTVDDAMATFFTGGAKTKAGIFANHTTYEVARSYNLNGDETDTGYADVDDIGKIYKSNGANKIVRSDGKTDSWNGPVPITGRGVQFPPFSSDGYKQAIFSSSLYRNLELKKIGDATVKGIDMRHFQVDPLNYDPTYKDNQQTYYIKYNGVMDYGRTELVSGAPNIPILATNPHLFNTDRTLFQGIQCSVSSTDSPTRDCFTDVDDNGPGTRNNYTTNFYIEPLTGIPMKGNAVVQFWVNIDPAVKASVFGLKNALKSLTGILGDDVVAKTPDNNIPSKPIPVCYLRDTSELTDKNAEDFKNTIYAGQKMGQTMGVALPVIGAFLLVFSFALLFWHVKLVKEGDSVNKP